MNVISAKENRLATVTLDRPPVNVLDLQLLRELDGTLDWVAADLATDLLVLRGAGDRAFSAGVDIRDHTREKVPEMLGVVHGVIRKLLALPQITIAFIDGLCLGGACEL